MQAVTTRPDSRSLIPAWAWPLVLVGFVALGIVAASRPIEVALVGGAFVLVAACARWVEIGTLATCGLLYTNAAGLAVKFHGVPFVVAAVFPALLAFPLYEHLVVRRERIRIPAAAPLVLLYVLSQALGLVVAPEPEVALAVVVETLLEGVLVALAVLNAVRTPETLRRVTWTLVLGGALMGIVPVLQQLTGTHHVLYLGFGQVETHERLTDGGVVIIRRLAGSIGEINRFAQLLLVLLPLALFRVLREEKPALRLLALVCLIAIGGGFATAFSRGGAVGMALLLGAMLLLRTMRPSQLALPILGALVLFVSVPEYRQRFETVPSPTRILSGDLGDNADGAVLGRLTIMIAAWNVFLDNPVVGVGPGMFAKVSERYGNRVDIQRLEKEREAHSFPLDVAAEGGLMGLIGILGTLAITLVRLLESRRRCLARAPDIEPTITGVLLALIAFLSAGLFLHLTYARYFWFVVALAWAADHIARDATRTEEQSA